MGSGQCNHLITWSENTIQLLIYIGLFIWELPQNIGGLLYLLFSYLLSEVQKVEFEKGRVFIELKKTGVSLGFFVFWPSCDNRYFKLSSKNKMHEFGHSIQSRILGPLYLLLVGIPSILRVLYRILYYTFTGLRWKNYYKGYPEDWADRLGDIIRWQK